MRRTRLKAAIGGFILAAALSTPLWGANPARPGTVNYVEGQVLIGTQALDSKSVGSTELQPGQSLTTEKGKAEVLLAPGVFLRLDDNSLVKMITPGLADTEVGVEKGRATVEVAEIHKENVLRIREDHATTELLKTGLYDFDADHNQIRVFDGQALVRQGDQQVKVKGGRDVMLNTSGPLKAQKFDKKTYQDDFYRWGSLRSAYLAEANVDTARIYLSSGWAGGGWYWDPWFGAYTYIPGRGIFYSPFGWGFYSPRWVYGAPGFYYPRYYSHRFDPHYRYWGPGPHYGPGYYPRGYGHDRPQYGLNHAPAAPQGLHEAPGMGPAHSSGGFRGGRHR